MAKLFLTEIPNRESIESSASHLYPTLDRDTVFSHILLRKLATEVDSGLEAFFGEYNLSAGRFTLMTLLNNSKEGLMPSALAQTVGVTQATISGLINSLEKAGLAERTSHVKDGRSFVIILTQNGQELYNKILPIYQQCINDFWSEFSSHEKEQLNTFMERIVRRFTTFQAEQQA